MLIHQGSVYVKAEFPSWVQKLKQGVPPETKAHHKHLLNDIKETMLVLDRMISNHGDVVFEPEDFKKMTDLRRLLERYYYPIALVEAVEEDLLLL